MYSIRSVNRRNDGILSALTSVAYEKLGAIFPFLVARKPAPTPAANECPLGQERMEPRFDSSLARVWVPWLPYVRHARQDSELRPALGAGYFSYPRGLCVKCRTPLLYSAAMCPFPRSLYL